MARYFVEGDALVAFDDQLCNRQTHCTACGDSAWGHRHAPREGTWPCASPRGVFIICLTLCPRCAANFEQVWPALDAQLTRRYVDYNS